MRGKISNLRWASQQQKKKAAGTVKGKEDGGGGGGRCDQSCRRGLPVAPKAPSRSRAGVATEEGPKIYLRVSLKKSNSLSSL